VQTRRLESPHFTALLPALAVEAGQRFRSAEIATALLNAIRIQPISVVEFSHDYGEIAAGCFNTSLDVFDASNGKVKRILPQNASVLAVRYSSDGTFLASSDDGRHVHIYETGIERTSAN
jgi:WD40 repeat protein